jgi:threonine/homoserine/homoserine lactone efflux protein
LGNDAAYSKLHTTLWWLCACFLVWRGLHSSGSQKNMMLGNEKTHSLQDALAQVRAGQKEKPE